MSAIQRLMFSFYKARTLDPDITTRRDMCIYKCYMYVQGLGEATLFKEETRYPQASRSHRWGHIDVNVVCEDHSMAHARRLSNVTAANKCIANGVCGVMAGHYGRRIICR